MKTLTLLHVVLMVCSLAAKAESVLEMAPDTLDLASQKVFNGSFEKVVCVDDPFLRVRAPDLNRVLFTVPNHSPAKVFQGWGENKRTKRINGSKVTFIKVQFPAQGEQVGWIAEYLVRPRSLCRGADSEITPAPAPAAEVSQPPVSSAVSSISGLNDPECCFFPVKAEPTASYETEQRRFGARRSGGKRLHAACDLYRMKNEPVYSVAPGRVLRDPYHFYQGTYALEVRHAGGFVVRYGEITARRVSGVLSGREVKMGQMLGYVGKVNSNCCKPMLHFELYSGAKNGSLNRGSNKYLRRPDLMNPTAYLKRWEENTLRHRR